MKSFVEIDIKNKGNYIKMLSEVSKLSGLFSESSVPFINYRVAENIFCKSFNANNLSRSDIAFDANYNSIGVGLKTFTCPGNSSTEKIAEFNSLSSELFKFKGKDLANDNLLRGDNYIILPLYGIKNKQKIIFERSGLNQWNARGRQRDFGEVYIPIPISIHKDFPK